MTFKDPIILLLIPIFWAVFIFLNKKKVTPSLTYPSSNAFLSIKENWKVFLTKNMVFSRLLVITLFIFALSGPREVLERTEVTTEGIDIVLVVDASGSMAAQDFTLLGKRVDRLEAVKSVVNEFIDARKYDRLGLVAFAAEAYVVCPLTSDHEWLKTNLNRINLGVINEDGTAIGSAVASALGRLKESTAKSKIIILLTDGVNNTGKIEPLTAAKAGEALGIKIYTIGAGTKGLAPFPVQDLFGRMFYQNVQVEIDEDTLKEIAKLTHAEYFRATDTKSLEDIYKQIDKMEKTEIKQAGYQEYKQLFWVFLSIGVVLLCLELILSNTILLRIP
ncbi:MAG: VWA domain-containing protein [Candidatus Omnitrophica bacterium]|nr:VWA domain-containing protein [Candidatus Omnitrophota bacterium]